MSDVSTLTPLARLWLLPDEVSGTWGARRALAASIRALSEACVRTEATVDELDAARALVDQATAALPAGRTAADAFADGSYFENPAVYVDRGALLGRSNPVAPLSRVTWDQGRSLCDVTLGEVYVGAPGMVHGGVIAAVFDQICGHCMVLNGLSGLTAKLSVSYRKPTRIHVPLHFEAWLDRAEGRRLHLRATCSDDQGVTAEADGLFVSLDSDQARALIGAQSPGDRSP